MLAKVKEQDGMMLAKVKEQDACKSKGTRWDDAKSQVFLHQRLNCCDDMQQMQNPLSIQYLL